MPPFRVIARHPDKDHHDHAWFAVGGHYDYEDEAKAAAKASSMGNVTKVAPQSLDPEEPIKPDQQRLVSELAELGYEMKVQELPAEGGEWNDVKVKKS